MIMFCIVTPDSGSTVLLLFHILLTTVNNVGSKTLFSPVKPVKLSAEQKFTRDHWRKQNPPVCGKILRDFWHA